VSSEEHTEEREPYLKRLTELLCFRRNRLEAKTQPQLAVELIKAMEESDIAPHAYVVDNAFFAPVVIECIDSYGKPWVADSEKNRVLHHKGQRYNCESFTATLPDEAFRKVKLTKGGEEKTYWVFTCCVRVRRYGKVRFAVIYDNPHREGDPDYVMSNMTVWNATKLVSVRSRRWGIEPFHDFS
jgi:hypothetical protein